jgi:hypothetical protein
METLDYLNPPFLSGRTLFPSHSRRFQSEIRKFKANAVSSRDSFLHKHTIQFTTSDMFTSAVSFISLGSIYVIERLKPFVIKLKIFQRPEVMRVHVRWSKVSKRKRISNFIIIPLCLSSWNKWKICKKFEASAQGQDGSQTDDELTEFFNFSSVTLPKRLQFVISSLKSSLFSYRKLLRAVSDV